MKNNLYVASAFVAILLLSGCSSTPSSKMTSIGGKFYMVGDSNCAYYKKRDESSILCANENRQTTGYRNALSDQELQYRMHSEKMQVEERKLRAEQQKNSAYSSSDSVQCVKFGSFGFKQEVKTFKGVICPMGYMPDY